MAVAIFRLNFLEEKSSIYTCIGKHSNSKARLIGNFSPWIRRRYILLLKINIQGIVQMARLLTIELPSLKQS